MANFLRPFNFIKENRHRRLPDDLGNSKEPIRDGVVFNAIYLGNTLIDYNDLENDSIKAVKSIIRMAKLQGKKTKVALFITPKGIKSTNIDNKEVSQEFCIYRIASCISINTYGKIFAFIFRTPINETLECHAFICEKKKLALALTRSVVQSFTLANEYHEAEKLKINNAKILKKDISIKDISSNENLKQNLVQDNAIIDYTHSNLKSYKNGDILHSQFNKPQIFDKSTKTTFLKPTLSQFKLTPYSLSSKCNLNGYLPHSSTKFHSGFNEFDDNFISQHRPTVDDLLC